MTTPQRTPRELRSRWPRWLAQRPWPVLLGASLGFLACCLAGRLAARQQPYQNFQRFHFGIGPETQFFPTFSQLINLAREAHRPGTTLVIVGGSSILQGVGQRAEHLWTKALQTELGAEFSVINLAMRGGRPYEFTGLVVEHLAAQGIPVLFVTTALPSAGWGDWDGNTYRWLFWEGWGKGLIPSDPRRDEWLAEQLEGFSLEDNPTDELHHRGRIDGVVYAADLWSLISYRYFGTIWTPVKGRPIWTPHRLLPDSDPGDAIPFARRFNAATAARDVPILQAFQKSGTAVMYLTGRGCAPLLAAYEERLPALLRDRTLYVLRMEAIYDRDLLTADERTQYEQVYLGIAEEARKIGLHLQTVGQHWEAEDYADRSHISESGGRKLARDIAPSIRALRDERYPEKTVRERAL